MIQAYGLSDTGCVRANNQDRILIDEAIGLFLLADGMGGHGHGETAAELALAAAQHAIRSFFDSPDDTWPFGFDLSRTQDENRLSTAIQLANHNVWRHGEEDREYAGMGTTLVGALVSSDRLTVGNVGDSRVYLVRGDELIQLTVDDTWVGNLIRTGALTEEQAKTHTMRHVLTQAVGSAAPVEVKTSQYMLQHRDMVLITTDGIHGVVEPEEIPSLLAAQALEDAARSLVEAALRNGGPDNASCILLRYSAVDA